LEDDTVWLNQTQLANLFSSCKQNISLHINNIFREGELDSSSTVREYLTVQMEGERQVNCNVNIYSLDAINAVGFRVKSQQGTLFRIWANKILKDCLLKGYALHQRIEQVEKKIFEHDQKFDLFIHTSLPPNEGIFFDGQIFDARLFVSGLVKSAEKSIILFDNNIHESFLVLISKQQPQTEASIDIAAGPEQLKLDIARFNTQYPKIDVQIFHKSNNRFLSIDRLTVSHIGASLKDMGKVWFAFSIINLYPREIIRKLNHFQYNPVCKGQSASGSIAPLRTPPWSLKYTDGSTSTTYRGITVSPYTITVSPAASKSYTVTALSDTKCTADARIISGTAVVNVNTNCQMVTLSQPAKLSAHNRNAIFIPGSKFHQTFALFRLSFTHTSDSGPP
jgi:hypothetical protein